MLPHMEHARVDLALVATVGTTPAVLTHSVQFHAPSILVLITSRLTAGAAFDIASAAGLDGRTEVVDLEDVEELGSCLDAARMALKRAYAHGPAALVVDFTGGTKAMAAGLVLAAAGRDVTFSYIGGAQRDSLGRVVDGTERVRLLPDPAPSLETDAWESLKRAWNDWRFEGAAFWARRLSELPSGPDHVSLYRTIASVCDGVAAWDGLDYIVAENTLLASLDEALRLAESLRHGAKVRVLSGLRLMMPLLSELVRGSRLRQDALATDLLANASRRLDQGAAEDAAVRVARAAAVLDRREEPEQGILSGRLAAADEEKVIARLQQLAARCITAPRQFPRW